MVQYPSAIFGNEYDMIHEAMEGVSASPEHGLGHEFIVSQWAAGIWLCPPR